MKATLLGDIHGQVHMIDMTWPKPIIQIGDFGFREAYKPFQNVGQDELMVVGGNHEHYPDLKTMPFYLGDFGLIPGTKETFFCRGAWSVDRYHRTQGIDWFAEEQLTLLEGNKMLDMYEQIKPRVMITHDCPDIIKFPMFYKIAAQTYTGRLLDECLKIHRPRHWFFGHWHLTKVFSWGDTCTFRCLAEGEALEVDLP